MGKVSKATGDENVGKSAKRPQASTDDAAGRRSMSRAMRELIIGYGGPSSEQDWDAGAFDRRSANAA
jgi:hypothetical protein